MKLSEEFIGDLQKAINWESNLPGSSRELIAHLGKLGIDFEVTKTGDLAIKTWLILSGFVSEEDAAELRAEFPPTTEGNKLDWLSENLQSIQENYAGQWIAIGNNEIVAAAPTLPELLTLIDEIDKPFITFIPTEPLIWTLTYGIEEL